MERKRNLAKLSRLDGSGDTSDDQLALQIEKRPEEFWSLGKGSMLAAL